MTNDDYTRMKIDFRLGHYSFFWRLMTFQFAKGWRQRKFPAKIDWYVFVENPYERSVKEIAQQRLHLARHPKDSMNRFILGNMLRMDGQIAAAREQYEQVALDGHGHWVQESRNILGKLEGVPDHRPGRSSHVLYHNNFHRLNNNPWK